MTNGKQPKATGSAIEHLNGLLARDPALRRDVDEILAQMKVVQELIALRERRGLTQKQLADRRGVTQQWIAKLESGRLKNLQLRTIVQMASALGARVNVELDVVDVPARRAKLGVNALKETARRARGLTRKQ